jgi:hypothetical protein
MKISTLITIIVCLLALGYGLYTYAGGKNALSNLGGTDVPYEQQATKNTQSTTYANSALGVSYTLPSDWWLYEANSSNFAFDAAKTVNLDLQEVLSSDGRDFLELISVGNYQYSNQADHIGLDLNAERVAGVTTIDGFMDYYDEFMLEPTDEYTYALESAEPAALGGKAFARRIYRVIPVADSDGYYYILAYITPIKNDYFLTITANYWPEMANAANIVVDHLESNLNLD